MRKPLPPGYVLFTETDLAEALKNGAHGVRMRSAMGSWNWRLFGPGIKGSKFIPTSLAKKLQAQGQLVVDRDSQGKWIFHGPTAAAEADATGRRVEEAGNQ